jgi:tRNA (guanine37-N1)-methyltransferase
MTLRVDVLTLFPRMFESPFAESIVARARAAGQLDLAVHDIRQWTTDRHRVVDDAPYGGGAGMVLKPEPLTRAIRATRGESGRVILMSAQGALFDEAAARRLAKLPHLVVVCGHYEGVDERVVEAEVDEEISIGDYVLTGGELAAMVVIDAVTRLVPGVIEPDSLAQESHTEGLLEGPHYTRPPEHEGRRVPGVLLSGDHAAIARWRRGEAIRRTVERRPDLLESAGLTPAERARLPRPRGPERVADADLVAAYSSGVGSYRIAARFGISPATVRSRLRAAGVRLRPPRGAQRGPTVAEVSRMRSAGLTVRELARHFGVSHVTILDRLKKAKRPSC